MMTFNEAKRHHLKRLEQFVPVVARVHGGSHPEFHEVYRVFQKINEKIKNAGTIEANLEGEFQELRKHTDDYAVPEDVCESYEAVYAMLASLDRAYHA